MCLRIDLGCPLQLGVLVKGPAGLFWQRFMFECLDGVCLRCGHFHLLEDRYRPGKGAAVVGLDPDNLLQLAEVDGDQRMVGPILRPWLLAIRWQELRQDTGVDGWRRMIGST